MRLILGRRRNSSWPRISNHRSLTGLTLVKKRWPPMSKRQPSRTAVLLMPPTTWSASRMVDATPRLVRTYAAVRPAGPAPITTTSWRAASSPAGSGTALDEVSVTRKSLRCGSGTRTVTTVPARARVRHRYRAIVRRRPRRTGVGSRRARPARVAWPRGDRPTALPGDGPGRGRWPSHRARARHTVRPARVGRRGGGARTRRPDDLLRPPRPRLGPGDAGARPLRHPCRRRGRAARRARARTGPRGGPLLRRPDRAGARRRAP